MYKIDFILYYNHDESGDCSIVVFIKKKVKFLVLIFQ